MADKRRRYLSARSSESGNSQTHLSNSKNTKLMSELGMISHKISIRNNNF